MSKPCSRRGFTLMEVMIGSALAAILMTAVLSTFLFIARNLNRLASYQSLETESQKALSYLRQDFMLAQSVKNGTTPTGTTVTLLLPSGEVTYTYDITSRNLRRQADFGPNHDFYLLHNAYCECTAFAFHYYTISDAAPTDQATGTNNIPYSIKQIQASFSVASPATWSVQTRAHYDAASSRYLIRNRVAPDGT